MRRTTARKAVATTPSTRGIQTSEMTWIPSAVIEIQAKARMIGLGFMERGLAEQAAERDDDRCPEERVGEGLDTITQRSGVGDRRLRGGGFRRRLGASGCQEWKRQTGGEEGRPHAALLPITAGQLRHSLRNWHDMQVMPGCG